LVALGKAIHPRVSVPPSTARSRIKQSNEQEIASDFSALFQETICRFHRDVIVLFLLVFFDFLWCRRMVNRGEVVVECMANVVRCGSLFRSLNVGHLFQFFDAALVDSTLSSAPSMQQYRLMEHKTLLFE
jgi:hypothetical protein